MTAPTTKRRALGKGLDVLFPGAAPTGKGGAKKRKPPTAGVRTVPIEMVEANRDQPRKQFSDDSLRQLADNIKQHGLMHPILVRKLDEGFEIIAGERRWRASQLAGRKEIEVIVKELSDEDAFLWAVLENIQREDLNPIESAQAYAQILDGRDLTQEALAELVGKDRSSVANTLRLLRLPDRVRKMVSDGAISMGHARALLALDSSEAMQKMAQEVVKRGLSVRQVEKLVRERKGKAPAEEPTDLYANIPGGLNAVRRETEALMRCFGTRVRVKVKGRRGKIEIDFSSAGELDRLIGQLKGDT